MCDMVSQLPLPVWVEGVCVSLSVQNQYLNSKSRPGTLQADRKAASLQDRQVLTGMGDSQSMQISTNHTLPILNTLTSNKRTILKMRKKCGDFDVEDVLTLPVTMLSTRSLHPATVLLSNSYYNTY